MSEQPATAKPKKVKAPSEDVLKPPPVDKLDVEALQAVARGEANAAQQQKALDWIIYFACGTYDEPYRSERPHDTIFANGRANVGRSINRVLRMKPGQIKE